MKTAKEMLAISETAREELDTELMHESQVMELIRAAAGNGECSIYVGWMLWGELRAKLEQHGYSVSDPIYENRDEGMFESCISWRNEE